MENSLSLETKTKSIFKNRNFLLLFIGKLVSQLGDVIYNMAIGWYILTITNSAGQMSIYMAIGTVVYIVAGPIGGVIADRFDRKKIIIWMDIIRGVAVAITGILMYFKIESVYIFYVTSAVLSICGALFVPASNALLPNIVDDKQLTKANSMAASVQSISGIIGTLVGGVLYALLGVKTIFILNAVSYILCGILEVFIVIPKVYINESKELLNDKKQMFKELLESYEFMKSKKGLFIMMWFSTIINLLITPLIAIFVPYIFNQILKASTEQYSYVSASSAVGLLIGAGILTILPQKEKIIQYIRMSLITFSVLFFSIYFVIAAYSNNLMTNSLVVILFMVIFMIFGIANSLLNIPTGVVIQRIVPNEILGKVSSLVSTLMLVATPLGMLLGGFMADILPINILIFIVSIIFFMITIYLCVQKDVREI